MTVRVQPDGYILELGRDGEGGAIATMACRTHEAGTELAESICANMRDKYWWRVFPVIFGDPDAAEARAQMITSIRLAEENERSAKRPLAEWYACSKCAFQYSPGAARQVDFICWRPSPGGGQCHGPIDAWERAPSDLAASADSPGPSPPHPEPMVKIDPDTGQRKSTPLRGPGDGACLNCGERVSEPITVTDGQAILQMAHCSHCGTLHTRDDDGWSVAVPQMGSHCGWCRLPASACACTVTDPPELKGP